MSKKFYIIIFLSVLLFKSENSFGQELKKELGICGKTIGAILQTREDNTYELTNASIQEKEFCDDGRYERAPNFIISLYNADKKLVYDKHVYLNPWSIAESVDKKEGSFKDVKLKKHSNSRIVKFPASKDMGNIEYYKIKSLEDKKDFEMKKIKWSL